MAKSAAKSAKKPAKGFTKEERAAMRDRAAEAKGGAEGEAVVLAKLASLLPPDRALGERLHALIKASAPALTPRLWYGMPAYARGGDTICFFQPAQRFKTRYATLGFSDKAKLDDGNLWPTYYALKQLDATAEAKIVALLVKALG